MDTSELTVNIAFSHTEDHPEWPYMAQVDIRTRGTVNPAELHQLMAETAGEDAPIIAVIHNPRDIHQQGVAMSYDFKTMGTSYCFPALKRFLDVCDKLGIQQEWANYNPRAYYTSYDQAINATTKK